MIPGMGLDPRMLKKMMKQMGMDMEELDAVEVVIKQPDGKQLVIKNPQVQRMKVPGQGESYQVMGTATEGLGGTGAQISEEDINLVAEQAKVPKEKAKEALEKNSGDIAKAILELQKN